MHALFSVFWQPLLNLEVNVSHFQWWWMPLFSSVFGIIIDTYILFQFSFFFILKLSQIWSVGALSSSLFFWYDLIILFLFPCCSTIRMFQLHPFNISLVIKFSFNPFSSLYYPRNVKQRSKYVTVSWCLDFSLAFSKSKSQVNDCSIGKSFRNWSQEAKMKGLGNWDIKGKKVKGMLVT